MATYIAGVTDYIPQIQPFQPDLNFYANVLQTRQSRYDDAKNKLNSIYSSVFNSELSREDNIKRRDAFMKAVDEDLKKISGLDLSLQQNADAAMSIFKGFYEDSYITNDIVKTKKHRSEMNKALALKACNDPKKCQGYWDVGVRDLEYKMQEFKNLSADEALNYDIGSYDAYVPWKEKAMELVMEKGYNAEMDHVTGNWIVTDKNGVLIKDGLEGLFQSVYGDDPRIQENYNTMARVARKDEIKSTASIYGSEDEATKQYVSKVLNNSMKQLDKQYKYVNDNYDQVVNKIITLEKTQKSKGKLNTQEQEAYNQAIKEKEILQASRDGLNSKIESLKTSQASGNMQSLLSRVDVANAAALQYNDINSMAEYLSKRGATRTYKANPYGEISARSSASMAEKKYQYELDKDLKLVDFAIKKEIIGIEHANNKELKLIEMGVQNGTLPSPQGNFLESANIVEATPGSTVQIDLEDNPAFIMEKQMAEAYQNEAESKKGSINYLYDVFKLAKSNAAGNNGAAQYLKNTYGDNWNNIKNQQDLLVAINKKKGSGGYYSVFNSTLTMLDSTKNTTGDIDWAKDYYLNNKKTVSNIKRGHDAYAAKIVMALNTNKDVVKKIKASATTDNKIAKYADLLISAGGTFIASTENAPKSFIEKYLIGEHNSGNISADEDEAQEVYEKLKDQFFTLRNTTSRSLTTGPGLSGDNTMSASGINYGSLNTKDRSGIAGDIVSDINAAISSNAYKAIVGSSNDEDAYEQENDAVAKMLLEKLVAKTYSTDKDKPTISALVSSIAASKENVGSFTIKLPKEFLDKELGTESKGDLATKKQKILTEGITLFVNKDVIDSKLFAAGKMSNTEVILRSGNTVTIDEFSDYAGSVKYSNFDPQKGTVRVTPIGLIVKDGVLIQDPKLEPYTIAIKDIDKNEAMYLSTLEMIQKNNINNLK